MHESRAEPAALTLIASLRELNHSATHLGHAFASSHGIYHTDFRALLLISHARRARNPLTAGELASALELSSGAVTYLVERLAQAGLVQREVDPQDRRKVLLVVTTAGEQLIHEYVQPINETVSRTLASHTAEQLQAAIEVLASIQSALDERLGSTAA